MKRYLAAIVAAAFLLLAPMGAAQASGGSDAPTPYQVTTEGVTLPEGDTFQAHGHVNVRYFDGDGIQQSASIHFDPNNDHPGGQWIGESFIPWSAFGITEGRITWVQIHGYNQHFGEGGQKPIPVGPKPEPGEETREDEITEHEAIPQCPTDEDGYGTVTETTTTYRVVEERTSTIEWDGADWIQVWSDWTEIEREIIDEQTQVREMTDDEYAECGLPPTGAPLIGAGIAALALMGAGGGALALRSRRR